MQCFLLLLCSKETCSEEFSNGFGQAQGTSTGLQEFPSIPKDSTAMDTATSGMIMETLRETKETERRALDDLTTKKSSPEDKNSMPNAQRIANIEAEVAKIPTRLNAVEKNAPQRMALAEVGMRDDADNQKKVKECTSCGGSCGGCVLPVKPGKKAYAGNWVIERSAIKKWPKQGPSQVHFHNESDPWMWNPQNINAGNWEAASLTILGSADVYQTNDVLDLSVTHLSKMIQEAFGDDMESIRQALEEAVHGIKSEDPQRYCVHQPNSLVFLPVGFANPKDIGVARSTELRELMVAATVAILERCFEFVVAVVQDTNELETRTKIAELKLGFTDVVTVALIKEDVRKTSMPLMAVHTILSLLRDGKWPTAKYIMFNEDDQLLMLRVPFGQLFDAAKEERRPTSSSFYNKEFEARQRFIALTPHRMQLVPQKYHQDVTNRALEDPMAYQICVLDTTNSQEQVKWHDLELSQKQEGPRKGLPSAHLNTSKWKIIYWVHGLPHFASSGNSGVHSGTPANQAPTAGTPRCRAPRPKTQSTGS
jgi:hypothetical protein